MDNDVLDTPTPPDPWAVLDAELNGLDLTTLLERLMARTGQTVPQLAVAAEIEQPVLYKILSGENREFKAEHADRLLEDMASQGKLTDPVEVAVWRKWLHVAAYVHFEEYKAALPRLRRIEDVAERLAALAEHLRQQYAALAQTYEQTGGQFPAGAALADLVARQLLGHYDWIRVPDGCDVTSGDAKECIITSLQATGTLEDLGPEVDVTRIEPGRYRVRRKESTEQIPAEQNKRAHNHISLAPHLFGRRTIAFIEPEMVLIPASEFQMGTSPSEERLMGEWLRRNRAQRSRIDFFETTYVMQEKPAHRLVVSDFWIARFPTTVEEYRLFTEGAKGYADQRWWERGRWSLSHNPDRHAPYDWDKQRRRLRHPVTHLKWVEAQAYCVWLSAMTGHTYRLPTEAEWEKAARGPRGSIWPWGNRWDAILCNSGESGNGDTTPVSLYPKGAARWPGGNVEDLAGNASEWCADVWNMSWYSDPRATQQDCEGPPWETGQHIYRGGFYGSHPEHCRSTARAQTSPDYPDHVGFRLVRSI